LPPSPLGLSNYDAFDLEDDIPDPYSHLDDDDDEETREEDENVYEPFPRSPSSNTSASYTSTLSTAPTGTSDALKTPPQAIYSDFNILDPGEPVVGDYDHIDEGMWPNTLAPGPVPPTSQDSSSAQTVSCSPNFPALFATSTPTPLTIGESSGGQLADVLDQREAELKKERERQRALQFMRFNPQ
jgi:hypothetical protein